MNIFNFCWWYLPVVVYLYLQHSPILSPLNCLLCSHYPHVVCESTYMRRQVLPHSPGSSTTGARLSCGCSCSLVTSHPWVACLHWLVLSLGVHTLCHPFIPVILDSFELWLTFLSCSVDSWLLDNYSLTCYLLVYFCAFPLCHQVLPFSLNCPFSQPPCHWPSHMISPNSGLIPNHLPSTFMPWVTLPFLLSSVRRSSPTPRLKVHLLTSMMMACQIVSAAATRWLSCSCGLSSICLALGSKAHQASHLLSFIWLGSCIWSWH